MDWIRDKALIPVAEKLLAGTRIDETDAMTLYNSADLPAIGRLADTAKQAKSGDKVFYVINRQINYSNLCTLSCMFCSFTRKRGDEGAYEWTHDQIYEKAAEAVAEGAKEIHMVGGLHPDLPYSWYLEMLDGMVERFPSVQLKCFTAVEIDYLAGLSKQSVPAVLEELKAHGLRCIPGGGAEILTDRVWKKIYKDKMGPDRWLQVHREAHEAGLHSNATMLYGHIETIEECVEHMRRLRELQDATGGFMTYIPLRYHPDNNRLGKLGMPSAMISLKHIAVGRLYLDNFSHIKTYWTMIGLDTSQMALFHGADDFDGTVMEEKITSMAGGVQPQFLTVERLRALIQETGRIPVERDAVYNVVAPMQTA